MMRLALFLGTNMAVLFLVSIVFRLLGIDGILAQNGVDLDLNALLIMSGVIGMSGSFISLAISKWMAKRSMGVKIIENPSDSTEQWLVATVRQQAERANIGMPEVGIFDSAQPNAFATGMNKNNALVAVSSGLLSNMGRGEVEAVLAHEVSHVANGDMVTMTLIQGVVNTFVIFFSRVIGHFIDRVILKNNRGHGIGFFISSMIAQVVLGMLASVVVMWFSRWREFRADVGGAELAGRQNMINALRRLQSVSNPKDLPDEMAGFGIAGGLGAGIKKLFMTHPPLEVRIAALQNSNIS